jgi:hypothetical protein
MPKEFKPPCWLSQPPVGAFEPLVCDGDTFPSTDAILQNARSAAAAMHANPRCKAKFFKIGQAFDTRAPKNSQQLGARMSDSSYLHPRVFNRPFARPICKSIVQNLQVKQTETLLVSEFENAGLCVNDIQKSNAPDYGPCERTSIYLVPVLAEIETLADYKQRVLMHKLQVPRPVAKRLAKPVCEHGGCKTTPRGGRFCSLHTDHTCSHCAAAFGTASNLTKHVRTVHEKRRDHACPQCDAAFGQAGTLTTHVRTVHKQAPPMPPPMPQHPDNTPDNECQSSAAAAGVNP